MTRHVRAARAEPDRSADSRSADRRVAERRLADPRITAVGLLMETVGGLSARLAAQYAEHDLSAAEFEVLLRLARTPGRMLRIDRKSTRLNSSHYALSRMPSSA